ncbi:MAG: hypothetical protein M0R33_16330 [Methylomonas sp.]|jgi:hypothetical protein|uniref:hypothetical protein n=1 Tax=Methylomonas sp. TaxID=418 RepID=UPI0025F14B97|nr:hypothetical protein [Methylomonas sp.]MCK9608010.1 hypothetical protein [Methylomonas sp.]
MVIAIGYLLSLKPPEFIGLTPDAPVLSATVVMLLRWMNLTICILFKPKAISRLAGIVQIQPAGSIPHSNYAAANKTLNL